VGTPISYVNLALSATAVAEIYVLAPNLGLAVEDYSITPREECWIDVMDEHH
jgi:hypothetical protein